MISVVIPTYNSRDYLAECLNALRNQTISSDHYEIIVVDDGSTDKTKELTGLFPIRYFYQSKQGPAVARNLGVFQAKGNIILFIDADCTPTTNIIETVLSSLFNDDNVVGVKGFYKTKQKEKIARFAQLEYEYKYKKVARQKYIDFVDTCAAAYRRDIFWKEGGFDSNFPIASGEDIDFSYRLSRHKRKLISNPNLIVYHHHPTTLNKYLQRKYKVGFWRVFLYRNHPQKIIKDSYTPQNIKLQLFILSLILILLPLLIANKSYGYIILVLLELYFICVLPFFLFCLRRDRKIIPIVLPVVFFRDITLIISLIWGVLLLVAGHQKHNHS